MKEENEKRKEGGGREEDKGERQDIEVKKGDR